MINMTVIIFPHFNQFCSSHTLQEVYITQFDTLDEHLQKALQEGCAAWAPGIEIISVRVTKPRVPEKIRINFEMMESEKTKFQIAIEEQKVAEKRADTKRKEATIEAQTAYDVAVIEAQKQVANQEAK
jgi:erlin